MDFEQLVVQFIVAVIAGLFIFIIGSTQRKFEIQHSDVDQKIKRLKEKTCHIKNQDDLLCKRILREKLIHPHRSIIAASVKQTIDDEIGKLQEISNSIRSIKHSPRPGLQLVDGVRFTDNVSKDSKIMEFGKQYPQPTPKSCLQQEHSKLSMFSNKKQPRFRQYSIYHFRVYLNNGTTPVNVSSPFTLQGRQTVQQ